MSNHIQADDTISSWSLLEKEHAESVKKGKYRAYQVLPLGAAFICILALAMLSTYGVAADLLRGQTTVWTTVGGVGCGIAVILSLLEGAGIVRIRREHAKWNKHRKALEKMEITDTGITKRLAMESDENVTIGVIKTFSKEEVLSHLQCLRRWTCEQVEDEFQKQEQIRYHSLMLKLYDRLRDRDIDSSSEDTTLYYHIAREQAIVLQKSIALAPELSIELRKIEKELHSIHIASFLRRVDTTTAMEFLNHPEPIRLLASDYYSIFNAHLQANQGDEKVVGTLLKLMTTYVSTLEKGEQNNVVQVYKEECKKLLLKHIGSVSFDDFYTLICRSDSFSLPQDTIDQKTALSEAFEKMAKEMPELLRSKGDDFKLYVEQFARTAARYLSALNSTERDDVIAVGSYKTTLANTLKYVTPAFRVQQGLENGCYYNIKDRECYVETTSIAYLVNEFISPKLSFMSKSELLIVLENSPKREDFMKMLENNYDFLASPLEVREMVYESMTTEELVRYIKRLLLDRESELDLIDEKIFAKYSPETLKETLNLICQEKGWMSALLMGKLLHRYINREIVETKNPLAKKKKRHTLATMQEYYFRIPEEHRNGCLSMLLENAHLKKRLGLPTDSQVTVHELRAALEKESSRFGKQHRSKTEDSPVVEKKNFFRKKHTQKEENDLGEGSSAPLVQSKPSRRRWFSKKTEKLN